MATIDELRARQADHSRQLAAVLFVKTSDLVVRWGVDIDTVVEIPRDELPFIEYGKSRARRYDPRDVEAYEERKKKGDQAA